MRKAHKVLVPVAVLVALVVAWSIHACRETTAHFEKDGARFVVDFSSRR